MGRHERERWLEDIDVDRVQASPRCIAAGWVVAAIVSGLISIGSATVDSVDVAPGHVKQDVAKAEHRLAQAVPRSMANCGHSG